MSKKYKIELSAEDKQKLLDIVKKGKASAREIRRAHTLLMSSDGKSDQVIAKTLHISIATVERTRKQFCTENLEATLKERKRSGKPQKLTPFAEAYLIATTCSDAPSLSARWTLRMLADKLVSLEIVDSLSKSTVGRILKKTS
ncbi:helix-turn-helix domain-containing protein [Nostoc sp. CHAB 5715]|uniref:helix-turn-helix domain-containing protein n=1 Tax=Nostoc sp. CHAB 5715 TaxID=2780400 RepID=UPI001E416A7B|nr:helix-turn-helix domain-containing protein [Nostoc sp. CHAB 5715]MCC5621092.1 helix-turn-helix domain-containing protein [Nostoc sp. CHAB 5715]